MSDRSYLSVVPQAEPFGAPRIAWPDLLPALSAEHRARGIAPLTVGARQAHLRRFAREVAVPPAEVTTEDLVRFLCKPEWTYGTRKGHRTSLADAFGWAHATGLIPSNPAAGMPTAAQLIPPPAPADSEPVTDHPQAAQALASATEHPARTWARATGRPHAATGRVPADLLNAWQDAGRPVLASNADTTAGRWATLVDDYCQELVANGLRPSTLRLRRHHLNRFSATLCEEPAAITRDAIIGYLADPDWSQEYRRSNRASVVGFFRWAYETERLPANPARRLPGVRIPHGVPDPAPETVIRDAINGARPDVRLMILLGSLAGLRVGEITSLHTRCLTTDGLRIVGKGGRSRMIPTHPVLVDEIAAYRAAHGIDDGYLFTPLDADDPYTVNHVGRLISNQMPTGWTAHKLRHRFASRSYAAQFNLRAVQELLGHASPAVTARYVAVPEAAARDAVLAVPPIPGIEAPDPTRPDTRRRGRPRAGRR